MSGAFEYDEFASERSSKSFAPAHMEQVVIGSLHDEAWARHSGGEFARALLEVGRSLSGDHRFRAGLQRPSDGVFDGLGGVGLREQFAYEELGEAGPVA